MSEWKAALDALRSQIGEREFKTWFEPINLLSFDFSAVDLEVPNRFYLSWLAEKYRNLVEKTLFKVTGRNIEVRFHVADMPGPHDDVDSIPFEQFQNDQQKHTLQNFIFSEENTLVQKIVMQIAEATSNAFNPIFFFGLPGVGKSHLLQGIKNHLDTNAPAMKSRYINAENFMRQLDESLKLDIMPAMRQDFLDLDTLLFDDVQKLSGNPRHNHEFQSMITSLHDAKKQLVFCSDRLPRNIPRLTASLRSRLSSGLIVPIYPADFLTKKRILSLTCATENIALGDDIIEMVAGLNEQDMGLLIHFIIRLGAISSIGGKKVDREAAEKILSKHIIDSDSQIERIQKIAAEYFKVKLKDLLSNKKTRTISLSRQVAMYLCRSQTGLSYSKIGERFGARDHSTVLKAHHHIRSLIESDSETRHAVNEIYTLLKNS